MSDSGSLTNSSITPDPRIIGQRFAEARARSRWIPDFPGAMPGSLVDAYAIQDVAIEHWPDRIWGWKVGRILGDHEQRLGKSRFIGPIFAGTIVTARTNEPAPFPVIPGGFAAVETEFVARIGRSARAGKLDYTADEAARLIDALHIGVEVAGSPLTSVNDLGPEVSIAAFGNNVGLILGPALANARDLDQASLICETYIDGLSVGTGGAHKIPGGPAAAVAFALGMAARRGRPLKAGDLVSTGATTGIHPIAIGQHARAVFAGIGAIECVAVAATPLGEGLSSVPAR